MADINEILGRQINSVKELKKAIRDLQDSLVGVDTESEQYKTTTQQLSAAQDELAKVTMAGKGANDAAKDSIVGMQQEYKKLYDTYKMLTEEQRNSDFGKEMANSLKTLSDNINERKKEVGDFKNNIGRYAESVSDAFSKMGVSAGALKGPLNIAKNAGEGLGKTFKALAKNPWMLALTALIAIITKVVAAIKQNEELMNRLKVAMAAFKPVLDAVSNAFDFLAGILVKAIEGLSKVGEKILSVIPGMKKAIDSHKELAAAENELTKATREANIENSKKQAEIERLREEASETDNVIEKKKLLEEAKALQAEIDQKNIELAQEELRILQEYAEKTANSAEENEKLAAAQEKVNEAIAQGERNMRMYNKQITQAEKGAKGAAGSTKNYREEAKKLYEQTIEDNKTELTKLTEKYEKEKKLLEKYHYDTKLLTKKYNEERQALITAEYNKEREKRLEQLRQARADFEAELGVESAWSAAMSKIADKSGLLVELEEVQEKVKGIATGTTFAELGDEFKDVKEKVEELNAKFGLSITTIGNLGIQVKKTKKEIAEEFGNEAFASINEYVTSASENLYNGVSQIIKSSGVDNVVEEYILEAEYGILEQQKRTIEKQLVDFRGTQEQKLELLRQYYDVVKELTERTNNLQNLQQENTWNMINSLIDAMDSLGSALGTIKGSYDTLIDSELKAGKIDEQEARKKKERLQKLEKIESAFAIATIISDAATGIFSIWKGYAAERGTINPQTAAAAGVGAGPALTALNAKSLVSAISQTAALATTATAQIMAVRNKQVASNNNFSADAGGSAGVAATPVVIDSTPYSYTRTVQTQEDEDYLNQRPVWVSVVDVESALGQQAQVRSESSF